MHEVRHIGFDVYFSKLPDPRISRKKLYPLIEILFVVLCGRICGAESWRDFVLFGSSSSRLKGRMSPYHCPNCCVLLQKAKTKKRTILNI